MIQTDFCMNTIPLVYPLIEFPLHTGEISAEARGKSINIQDQVPPLGLSSSISPGPAHLPADFRTPLVSLVISIEIDTLE